MTNDVKLPRVGDEFTIRDNHTETGDTITLVVTAVAKRGRGFQVLTDHGKFRLKDFNAAVEEGHAANV